MTSHSDAHTHGQTTIRLVYDANIHILLNFLPSQGPQQTALLVHQLMSYALLAASSSFPMLMSQSPSSNPVVADAFLSAPSESMSQSAQHLMNTPSHKTLESHQKVSPIDKYLHIPVQSGVRK